MSISIQSSNSTYTNKGSQVFEREVTFSGAATFAGGVTLSNTVSHALETIAWTSGGLSPSTAVNYGITFVSMTGTDPSTSPRILTLAAPTIGLQKTIIVGSTVAYVNTVNVDCGAGVGVGNSTTNRFIAFSTLATEYQSVTLVGVTTASWAVLNCASTVGNFGEATGIRATNVSTTS